MTDDKIKYLIASSENLIILFFSHDGCQPCKTFKPILNDAVDEFNGNVSLVSIDVTESNLGNEYGVRSVPTTILIKDGITLEIRTTTMSAHDTKALIREYA